MTPIAPPARDPSLRLPTVAGGRLETEPMRHAQPPRRSRRRTDCAAFHHQLVSIQDEALARYRAGDFDEAARTWQRALAVRPSDGPARVMIARCERYAVDPPPEGWRDRDSPDRN